MTPRRGCREHVTAATVRAVLDASRCEERKHAVRDTLGHLAHECPTCRALLERYVGGPGRGALQGEGLREELDEAQGLLRELVDLHPYRAHALVLASSRFHRWGLAMRLIELAGVSEEGDPPAGAELAVAVADRLEASRYPRKIIADAQARARATLAEQLRREGALGAAAEEIDRAEELVARGTGSRPLGAQLELARTRWLLAVGRGREAAAGCLWVLRRPWGEETETLAWEAVMILARIERQEGRPAEAAGRLEGLAERMRTRAERRSWEWDVRLSLADALGADGRWRESMDALAKLRVLAADSLDDHQRGRLMALEGRALAEGGEDRRRLREAEELLARAVAVLRGAGRGLDATLASLALARLHRRAGHVGEVAARIEELSGLLGRFGSGDLSREAMAAVVALQARLRRGELAAGVLERCHERLTELALRWI